MKSFVFLYPIPEYFDSEIKNGFLPEDFAEFRQKYRRLLNKCIDVRYRQNGFKIFYALFDDHELSDVIDLRQDDRIVCAGLDFKTHTTERPDRTFPYPDPEYILTQMGDVKVLRVAGFHMWDCVEKFARCAYEKGIDTLVDEDLTEFFTFRIKEDNFVIGTYPNPNFQPDKNSWDFLRFISIRKERPWLWQDY